MKGRHGVSRSRRLRPALPYALREAEPRRGHKLLTAADCNQSKVRESRCRVPGRRSSTIRPDAANKPESTAAFGKPAHSPAILECAFGSGEIFRPDQILRSTRKGFR